ncbi:hypothetical protein KSP40_PGU014531 [Platanthera guangdongensis]|uniref:Ribosomal protein S3 n=1 Tax=Platanthera guangdongensis TaxID=2320717 RepID=A0ABR2LXV4_9ASPA
MNASEISGVVVVRQSVNTEGSKTLDLQWLAATRIQESWKDFLQNMHSKRSCAAIKIQSQWRCWSIHKYFICQVDAIKTIQSTFQSVIYQKDFQKKRIAAIEMQSFIRGHLIRTKLLGASKIRSCRVHRRSYSAINDSFLSNFELRILVGSVVKLQSWWKQVLLHRSRTHAAISYQSFFRGWIARRDAAKRKRSISTIQVGLLFYNLF